MFSKLESLGILCYWHGRMEIKAFYSIVIVWCTYKLCVCRIFLLTCSHTFHYVYVVFQVLFNTFLWTAAFGSLRPEKCPQVCITSSGKPVILPQQEQQQGQERCSLPPAGQEDTVCTAQAGDHSLNEVHLDQTSKLQVVPEENRTETLSSKDEHLQTWALYGVNHAAWSPFALLLCVHFRIPILHCLVCFQSRLKYCMSVHISKKQKEYLCNVFFSTTNESKYLIAIFTRIQKSLMSSRGSAGLCWASLEMHVLLLCDQKMLQCQLLYLMLFYDKSQIRTRHLHDSKQDSHSSEWHWLVFCRYLFSAAPKQTKTGNPMVMLIWALLCNVTIKFCLHSSHMWHFNLNVNMLSIFNNYFLHPHFYNGGIRQGGMDDVLGQFDLRMINKVSAVCWTDHFWTLWFVLFWFALPGQVGCSREC